MHVDRVRLASLVTLTSALFILLLSSAYADSDTGQFCWAFARYTHTVYYGDIEGREDRSASFTALLEISGIVHFGALCPIQKLGQHRSTKQRMLDAWRAAEFDVIDTTFLSDLDY